MALNAFDNGPIRRDLEAIAEKTIAVRDDARYQYFKAAFASLGEIEELVKGVRKMIEACEEDYLKGRA